VPCLSPSIAWNRSDPNSGTIPPPRRPSAGSITAVVRRCGKPSCHCAKPNDPGHDPQFRLTRRVSGKSMTESFPNPAALRKAQQEVAEFHRFQRLGEDLIASTKKSALFGRRTATRRLDRAGKKTAAAIHQEISREVNQLLCRIFAQRRNSGSTDLEAIESALRAALHQAGAGPWVNCCSSRPGCGSGSVALRLRSSGAISGVTLPACAYRGGLDTDESTLVSLPALS